MALKELDNSNINKHLGKSSEYASNYDPSLLVREPRQSNRTHINVTDGNLPFTGGDTWNGYEVTGLTNSGRPVVGVAKFVYPCDSKYIVESKSLKLYFNSFCMTHLGETEADVLRNIEEKAAKDLSEYLETTAEVRVFSNFESLNDPTFAMREWHRGGSHSADSIRGYITLEDSCKDDSMVFETYSETPELLDVIDSDNTPQLFHSALLRSRCRVTSQPDSGDVYIYFKGGKTVTEESLLKYIVSFRDECHFHEEICETIYTRLFEMLEPDELAVRCLYARRGGWDINPERVSDPKLLHHTLGDIRVVHVKTPKQ
jgi:7-cyano-7-deazaguanine reductase